MTATNIAALRRVNGALVKGGVGITKAVGTMWCALLFTLLSLVSLPAVLVGTGWVPARVFPVWALNAGLIALVAWVAQTFLQLVLLPIIIVGQNATAQTQAEHGEALSSLHDKHDSMLRGMRVMHAALEAIHANTLPVPLEPVISAPARDARGRFTSKG